MPPIGLVRAAFDAMPHVTSMVLGERVHRRLRARAVSARGARIIHQHHAAMHSHRHVTRGAAPLVLVLVRRGRCLERCGRG
jgi:hypothetical protein